MKISINKQNKENILPPSNASDKIKSNISIFKNKKEMKKFKDINDSIAIMKLKNEKMPQSLTEGESSDEFDKLLEITSKCVDYYNKFIQQKNSHLQIIDKAFVQIQGNMNKAFKEIIDEATQKNNQLNIFLKKKHQQLINEKIRQEEELKSQLDQIKSIHLTNLLKDSKSESYEFSNQLSNFAGTLNKFYNIMSEIEKNNYEENVDQCVSFINNLINQEIKNIVQEKIPHKFEEMMSFSFNNEKMFTFESTEKKHLQNMQSAQQILLENSFSEALKLNQPKNLKIAQELAQIQRNQKQRKNRMQGYLNKLQIQDFASI